MAFQGMLGIGNLNKDKDGYARRSNTSVNPFVSLDSEILCKCVELVKETFDNREATDKEIDKLVSSGSFAKLYGKLLANKKQLKPVNDEGIWIKYNYETEKEANQKIANGIEPEYLKLYNSLQGYNTGWCTAGSKETAKNQICGGGSYQGGDFYVFYTKNNDSEYKVPRIAIRMDKDSIGEIRGVSKGQNIESNMETVLDEKLKEFPDGMAYQKKVCDMKMLTQIYDNYQKRELTKEELTFLYEIYDKISGFGYQEDPRIFEILANRDARIDLSNIFDCSPSQIGFTSQELYTTQLVYYENSINYDGYQKLKSKGFRLPKYINGNLLLDGLESSEGLVLPETVKGMLSLSDLNIAEGLILPQNIGSHLDLGCLASAKGVVFPNNIKGNLDLSELETSDGLILPKNIGGDLILNSLITINGLKMPEIVGQNLFLISLESAKDIVFPERINGDLNMENFTIAENVVLPKSVGGTIDMLKLNSLIELTLPNKADCEICYNYKYYVLEELIELQQKEINKSLKK